MPVVPPRGPVRGPAAPSPPAQRPPAPPRPAPRPPAPVQPPDPPPAPIEPLPEKPPYFRFAASNPYNLSLVAGGLAAAVLTLNPLLALATIGIEGLWLLWAPDSKTLKTFFWDKKFERMKALYAERERAERFRRLGPAERVRVANLITRQGDIQRLAARNPSFTGELLRTELRKTERLVEAFLDMALTTGRYEDYLSSVDVEALERDRERWEQDAKNSEDGDPRADLARKNLSIILRRIEKMKEIRHYLTVARGQLDLIENSFQLIADQIVTMQSPHELSGQLNELLDGVESIRQTAVETDRILNALGTGA